MAEKKENAKKKKSIWKTLLIVLCVVLAVLLVAVGGFVGYLRLSVGDYYAASEQAFRIPGLHENFVPQGFHYDEKNDHFLVGGYCSDHSASPVYVVDAESGETVHTVRLAKADGSDFCGHAGGIAVYGDFVYVAGGDDRCLYVWSYEELLTVEDGGTIACLGSFSTKASDEDFVDVSFVTVSGDRLLLGEFYDEPSYPTLDSHKMTTSAGDYQQAVAVEYHLSESAEFGIDPTPVAAYSLPDCVQGLTVDGDTIYLSTSYGLSFSQIYEYRQSEMTDEGEIALLGYDLPLYAMDSASLVHTYEIAPMSEEMVMLDGKLYVMCESASNKYMFGKLTGGEWCYATDLKSMKS